MKPSAGPRDRTIIIGAGSAGLAAAKVLARAGGSVLILEASDRIGGRIRTLREGAESPIIELGAEFVHGRPDSTWALIRECRAVAYDIPFEHWRLQAGRLARVEDYTGELARTMRGLARLRRDVTFAEYLRRGPRDGWRAGETPSTRRAALDFVRGFDAADPEKVSAKSLAREQEGLGNVGGEMQFRLLGGYAALLDHLRAGFGPGRVRLRLNTPVTAVEWSTGGVSVRTAGGGRYTGRSAIIALPLGVLQLPLAEADAVHFTPDIPEKRLAITHLSSGPVVKVVLVFDAPFWEEAPAVRAARAGESFRDVAFMHGPGLPIPTWWTARPLRIPLLTGWAGGPDARAVAGRSEAELVDLGLRSVARLMHRQARSLGARLKSGRAVDWGSERWTRGAYSSECIGGERAREALARPLLDTLFFAGEATDTSGQASTVAGALASGERAAREVLEVKARPRRKGRRV